MSIELRQALVRSGNTIFQNDSQRLDLLNVQRTQTGLVAICWDLVCRNHYVLFTAIRSDHHDDSALGEHCHANGFCADVWFNRSPLATDYLDATDERFQHALRDLRFNNNLYQIGLGGSADIAINRIAAGPSVFSDDGADHVHIGAHN